MADDHIFPSISKPKTEEEDQDKDEHEENSTSVSNNNNDGNRNSEDDERERRIEMLDMDQESIKSRMSFRERTSQRLSRSMLILSLNLEFIAGIYAYLRIRPRNLSWKARAIRVLPLFLIPALATLFSSLLCRFTIILNLRDLKSLEKVRKERLARIQELAQSQFQNYYHGESSSTASTSRSNLRDASESTNGMNFDAHEHLEKHENSKSKLKCLVICTNCRMHNGFASKEALEFLSYTCSHCKAHNGHDIASCSAVHAPQSIPYNPPYNENENALPRGIFIEELSPSQEITDPEMDPSVMIIRESPSVADSRENSMENTFVVHEMPRGLLIEEITQNREINEHELDSPVITQESAGDAEGLLGGSDERPRGLLIQEITENREINEHELDPPVIFQESSVSTVLDPPVIEELTPNQEIVNREMETPFMYVQVSPSVTGEEELSREDSLSQMDRTDNAVSDDVIIPDDDVTSVTVQELPLETRELIDSSVNETIVTYPDTDADVTPAGPTNLTRVTFQDSLTESNEIFSQTHTSNDNHSDSEGESTNGWQSVLSGQFGDNEVQVTEMQVQEGNNEEGLFSELRENEGAEMKVTYPDTDFEEKSETDSDYGSPLEDVFTQSHNQLNQEESAFNSVENEENEEKSVRIRDEEQEQNDIFMRSYDDDGYNDENNNDDDSDSNGSELSITGDKIISDGDETNWKGWQQAGQTESPPRVSEMPQTQEHEDPIGVLEMPQNEENESPISGLEMPQTEEHEIPISRLEMPQTEENEIPISRLEMPQTEEHESPISGLEMPQTEDNEIPISGLEMPQTEENESPIRVSEMSIMEEPQVNLSTESNLDDGKNSVGLLASKSESASREDPRKGIGGNLQKDDVEEKKGSQDESQNIELGEVSDKEGSVKKRATEESEADPVVNALLSSNATTDPKLKLFSTTANSRWGRSNDFEPAKFDGLRHRRSYTPPLIVEPPSFGTEQENGGSSYPDPPTEIDKTEGPVIGF